MAHPEFLSSGSRIMKADDCHRFLRAGFLCALLSGCAQPVKISYPSEASIHPAFNRPFTTWTGASSVIEVLAAAPEVPTASCRTAARI
jgi:hypothetical protein